MNVNEVINHLRFHHRERAITAEACVVDQQRKRLVTGDASLNLRESAGIREIGYLHLGVRVRLTSQLLS